MVLLLSPRDTRLWCAGILLLFKISFVNAFVTSASQTLFPFNAVHRTQSQLHFLRMQAEVHRRDAVSLAALSLFAISPRRACAGQDDESYLKQRFETAGTVESMPPPLPFGGENQLYWPKWMFGSWTVRSTLSAASLAPSMSQEKLASFLDSADVGSTSTYSARYFSTLADSSKNNMRVTLGLGVPEAEIIEDRQFNYKAETECFLKSLRVREAAYDPRADPTAVFLQLEEGPSGFAKKELFVENRKSAPSFEPDSRPSWYGSETIRTVSVGPKKVQVCEYEVLTKLVLRPDGGVTGQRRIEVFVLPGAVSDSFAMMRTESSLRVWSRLTMGTDNSIDPRLTRPAIASLAFKLDMEREVGEDGSVCVDTPKNFRQCQPPRFWEL